MGKRKDGITTIAKLRRRCSVARSDDPECCWIWKGGACGNGSAGVWVVVGESRTVMSAPRAALILTGRDVGPRTWTMCKDPMCCNPAHAATGTYQEWGAWIRESRQWVGNLKNIASAKMRGRERSKINQQIAREIRVSPLPATDEARRVKEEHGIRISRHVVDDVRKGRRWAEPNPFAGLGARA